MLLRLFLLFTLVPTLELYLLFQVAALLGPTATVLIVVLTGMVGSWLARREGWNVLGQMRDDLQKGIPPATRIAEGVLVIIGGVLLVTPGIMTDFLGFSLMIPLSRRLIAPRLIAYLTTRFDIKASVGPVTPIQPGWTGTPPQPKASPQTNELEGEHPFASPLTIYRETDVTDENIETGEQAEARGAKPAIYASTSIKEDGKIDKAEAALRDVIQQEPRLAEPHMELARLLWIVTASERRKITPARPSSSSKKWHADRGHPRQRGPGVSARIARRDFATTSR